MTDHGPEIALELLPCPFCGGGADIAKYGTDRRSMVIECQECGARVESGDTTVTAPATWLWNLRTPDPSALKAASEAAYERAACVAEDIPISTLGAYEVREAIVRGLRAMKSKDAR